MAKNIVITEEDFSISAKTNEKIKIAKKITNE